MATEVPNETRLHPARRIWLRIETIHAVTYFGAETVAAGEQLGLGGFWSTYFGFRAGPMGAVGAGVVDATFANFAPSFVARWVPEVWQRATPAQLVEARAAAAAQTLRAVGDDAAIERAVGVVPTLRAAVGRAVPIGRPLFAANSVVARFDDPLAELWQYCTTLREHRGDGHVAALAAAGLDGLEAHVLIARDGGSTPEDLQRTRGWTAQDWDEASARLHHRGMLDRAGLTAAGRTQRAGVEATTDTLAIAPYPPDAIDGLVDALDPLARAVSTAGVLRYPNPIGLPPLDA